MSKQLRDRFTLRAGHGLEALLWRQASRLVPSPLFAQLIPAEASRIWANMQQIVHTAMRWPLE